MNRMKNDRKNRIEEYKERRKENGNIREEKKEVYEENRN